MNPFPLLRSSCFALSSILLILLNSVAAENGWPSKRLFSGLSLSRIGPPSKPFGYGKMDALWPHVFGQPAQVPVCWEGDIAATRSEVMDIERAIESSWTKYARIDFTGWQKCQGDESGIHIDVKDVGPSVRKLGKDLDKLASGMTLNFDLKNWKGDAWCQSSQSHRIKCVKAIAIHEFGHALGLAHEQNRPDTPGECQELPQGPMGTKELTPWDKSSVMNYCNNLYTEGGAKLSDGDVVSVQKMYGPRDR